MQVARAVIGCVVLGHWPLNHHPARKAWEVSKRGGGQGGMARLLHLDDAMHARPALALRQPHTCPWRCCDPACCQDLLDATANIKQVPGWASALLTVLFVCTSVATSLVVTDLGSVLHIIGGTAARCARLRAWACMCMRKDVLDTAACEHMHMLHLADHSNQRPATLLLLCALHPPCPAS
jgi:hypothetical protein